MNPLYLRNHLNDFVGSGYGHIPRWAVRIYGHEDWQTIHDVLDKWQLAGYITILRNPEVCDDNDICLKMHNFIDALDPLPLGWIDEKKKPPMFG